MIRLHVGGRRKNIYKNTPVVRLINQVVALTLNLHYFSGGRSRMRASARTMRERERVLFIIKHQNKNMHVYKLKVITKWC